MAEREGEDLNLTDYENWLLARFDSRQGVPMGLERLTNERWVAHVKADLPKSDFAWGQYEAHVKAGLATNGFLTRIGRQSQTQRKNDHQENGNA